jgi:hypothetical protein
VLTVSDRVLYVLPLLYALYVWKTDGRSVRLSLEDGEHTVESKVSERSPLYKQ